MSEKWQTGAQLIAAERERQVSAECWTPGHDDKHDRGELAKRAAELAVCGTDAEITDHLDVEDCWRLVEKHRGDRLRQLVIAGALIAAEIDRLNRREAKLESDRVAANAAWVEGITDGD